MEASAHRKKAKSSTKLLKSRRHAGSPVKGPPLFVTVGEESRSDVKVIRGKVLVRVVLLGGNFSSDANAMRLIGEYFKINLQSDNVPI